MAYNRRDEDLAYGDYQGRPAQSSGEAEGERGLLGDMGKRFFGGSKSSGQSQQVRFEVHISRRALPHQHRH